MAVIDDFNTGGNYSKLVKLPKPKYYRAKKSVPNTHLFKAKTRKPRPGTKRRRVVKTRMPIHMALMVSPPHVAHRESIVHRISGARKFGALPVGSVEKRHIEILPFTPRNTVRKHRRP